MNDKGSELLTRVTAPTAAAVCQLYDLKKELRPHLDGEATPVQFLDRILVRADQVPDAVDFLAYALPKRERIWWGCLCVQLMDQDQPLAIKERLALRAAVRWALEPAEERRRAAQETAAEVSPTSPAGCLATAVSESGGSVLPPDQPSVEPTSTAAAKSVRNAIHLLAIGLPAPEMIAAYRRFVAIGIGLARSRRDTLSRAAE